LRACSACANPGRLESRSSPEHGGGRHGTVTDRCLSSPLPEVLWIPNHLLARCQPANCVLLPAGRRRTRTSPRVPRNTQRSGARLKGDGTHGFLTYCLPAAILTIGKTPRLRKPPFRSGPHLLWHSFHGPAHYRPGGSTPVTNSLPDPSSGRASRAISRRTLLRGTTLTTGLVLTGLRSTTLHAGDASHHDGTRDSSPREFILTAEEIDQEIMPGMTIRAWGYNGQTPGPEIRVREGDPVRIVLRNNLPVPTTIHWHGLH